MVKKITNENYLVLVNLDSADLDLGKKEITGSFEVEFIEKNYGTFEEDLSWKTNFTCISSSINNKKTDFETITQKSLIKRFILSVAKHKLDKHLYGE